jgi:hypothetical protein
VGSRIVLSLEGVIVTEVELDKPVTVVGRHPACDICIDHPAISGRHMLFRLVNQTVYVEDLASTNGTKVNGISTGHQVVHHLDLIEVGKHKVHFFDDSMLAGGVGNLENTVHTDFERTMMVAHAPDPAVRPGPQRTVRTDEDLSRTLVIGRDPAQRTGAVPESAPKNEPAPARAAGEAIALRVVSGKRAGEVIALDRANTMLGEAGGDTALVVKRGDSFYLARFGGNHPPKLNRAELGPGSHRIAPRDVIDVGVSRYEVIQADR